MYVRCLGRPHASTRQSVSATCGIQDGAYASAAFVRTYCKMPAGCVPSGPFSARVCRFHAVPLVRAAARSASVYDYTPVHGYHASRRSTLTGSPVRFRIRSFPSGARQHAHHVDLASSRGSPWRPAHVHFCVPYTLRPAGPFSIAFTHAGDHWGMPRHAINEPFIQIWPEHWDFRCLGGAKPRWCLQTH